MIMSDHYPHFRAVKNRPKNELRFGIFNRLMLQIRLQWFISAAKLHIITKYVIVMLVQ